MHTPTHPFRLPTCAAAIVAAAFLIAGAGAAPALQDEVTDANIRSVVEDRLFFDQAVPFDPIDVSCTSGIVTLTGTTDSLLAKELAARLAETVKGVRSVVNRIRVEPGEDRSAGALRKDIEAALVADPATESFEIDVLADEDGHVTLAGTVESWQERRLVAKVAKAVSGVTELTNDIDIDYDADRADQEIKPEIEEALRWNALVDHRLIEVNVNDGVVTLSGTVGAAAEKRQAHWDAWVAGVTAVNDEHLKVRDWAREEMQRTTGTVAKSASAIRDAITAANMHDPRVKSFNVTPQVNGSMVTLRGVVDNLKAKRAAARNARNTAGVARVINRLKVRTTVDRTDEQIETAVRNALLRDPYVDRYQITVNVINGTAYLSGDVDTYFEKAQADDAASRVNGVTTVSNALDVADSNWPLVYDPYVHDWYAYDYRWYDYEPGYTAKSESELRDDVESELWWSPFVDSNEVNTMVDAGVVTLTGTVDSWSERRAATNNALEAGAVRVINNLVVMDR